jgi:hypothetical protein
MAAAPEATTEFPTSADRNVVARSLQRPAVTARHLTTSWATAAGFVVAAAATWLILIAILIAI